MNATDFVFESMERRDKSLIQYTIETTKNIVLLFDEIESLLNRITELEKRIEELESSHA